MAEKIQGVKGEITQFVLDANYNVKKVTNPYGISGRKLTLYGEKFVE